MKIPTSIGDFLHWVLIAIMGVISFLAEHSNEIVALCASVAALAQVYIQLRRAKREHDKK